MRKLVLVAAALLLATAAAAQEVVPIPIAQVVGSVTPTSGGSRADPVSATVQVGFTLNKESSSTPRRIVWTLPRAVRLNPRGFPRCSRRRAGQLACRRKSVVGSGRMTVVTGRERRPLVFDVTVYANGPRRLTFALRSPNVEVERPVVIRGRRLRLDVPRELQRPDGEWAYLTNFSLELGPHEARGHPFAALVGCPPRRHQYGVEIRLARNPQKPQFPTASASARSRCRR